MSFLGNTFEEKYSNFFKFFSSKHTKSEIEEFILKNRLSPYSNSYLENIYLNMIDNKNLNILFHIIIKSDSDLDCLQKLQFLIEEYNINYDTFDFIHHRKLPFYTCVKGYLESTKYLINKMNFNINDTETDGKTLFFSAIKSYNINLMEYLDNKYPNAIFYTDEMDNSCIFNIFKKDIKNISNKDDLEKLKNILRYILKRGFQIDKKNNEGISFREICKYYQIDFLLNDVINELGGEKEKNKENINMNIVGLKIENNNKENNKNEKPDKIEKINEDDRIDLKQHNKIKLKMTSEIIKQKNDEINYSKKNFDYDIEMDDDFIKSESTKVFNNNILKIKKERNDDLTKKQNSKTKKKVCAFLSKKRHNLILNEETLNALRNIEVFKKYFIPKN